MDKNSTMRAWRFAACALALVAWNSRAGNADVAPAPREVEFGQSFQLTVGEETGFKGSPLRLRLLRASVGRCPPPVNCLVKPPDTAVVALSWGKDPGPELSLRQRGSSPDQSYTRAGSEQRYDVSLEEVSGPDPGRAGAYAAGLKVRASNARGYFSR